MEKLIFADGHLHSNPIKGMGIKVISKKFIDVGGWFIVLVSLPPYHFGLDNSFEGYVRSVNILINECRLSREQGLKTVCLAGVHPAAVEDEITRSVKQGVKVLEKFLRVVDYIVKLIREGLVDGFGEVGRPHYKASPEAFVINSIITRYTLTLARELNVPVHLHLEQGGDLTAIDIEEHINILSLEKSKTILHHVDVATAKASQARGMIFTVPGKYQVLKEVFKTLKPEYMVESDFIDDPNRPGVSSYPWDIAESQIKLLNEGLVNQDYLYRINVDTITKIYNINPP